MRKLIINGGKPLRGEVTISGAKNSTVALIPAAVLADSPVTLEGVPDIDDVKALIKILNAFNVKTDYQDGTLTIDPTHMKSIPMPTGVIKSMRASYYFMGATLTKFNEGVIGMPGGCFLGPRPIDQHIKGFEALGATVENDNGAISLKGPKEGLKGTKIYMDIVSIGATINVLLASVKAKGKTIIENAAREPEIIDLVTLLNKMGANIRGAGTNVIRVEGVEELHGCTHTIIPDRIEAGTYLAMAVAIGEGITVKNVIYEHLEGLLAKMSEMGVPMEIKEDSIFIPKCENLKMVNIKTQPYPGFATDLQQPVTPLLLTAHGSGTIIDTIYPKRVNHLAELARMGAFVKVNDGVILIDGPSQLTGAEVAASDLRAGACLVIAGLMAQGTTKISQIEHILRGYADIVSKLKGLGADITMIEE
ncbi:UDP-N-acetylglucosamine 1-carboxyvinyltransferase [Bavariicoccus seileri]|uniref:UDP-N-acetylglucosamine 1-carboxyvinyltransferase n=1 Tax=Bavariicoccus seileri TaxID=549685 RepID=UPI0003B4C5A1|nr:UDP-N-acetylglucosamine 1-carboxyvinyltransferase [Bavariicoccus seileri]